MMVLLWSRVARRHGLLINPAVSVGVLKPPTLFSAASRRTAGVNFGVPRSREPVAGAFFWLRRSMAAISTCLDSLAHRLTDAEAVFSRPFKREVGRIPAIWRTQPFRRHPDDATAATSDDLLALNG